MKKAVLIRPKTIIGILFFTTVIIIVFFIVRGILDKLAT